jgi:hypothetical protein
MKTKTLATLFMASIILVAYMSCKKDDTTTPTTDPVCIAKGSYVGTYTNQNNQSASFAYILGDNNFVTGGSTLAATPNAFGGYSNTCDSLKMQTYNTINSSYYYFAGKFSANKVIVTGIYKNLTTTSEVGTFTLTKQ